MPWFSLIGGNWKEELAVEDETLATVAVNNDVTVAVVVGLAHWYLTLSFAVICLSTSRSKQFASWTVCKYVCAEKFTYVVVDDVFEKCAVTYVGLNRCLWYYFSMERISSSLWKVDKSMKHQLFLVVLQRILQIPKWPSRKRVLEDESTIDLMQNWYASICRTRSLKQSLFLKHETEHLQDQWLVASNNAWCVTGLQKITCAIIKPSIHFYNKANSFLQIFVTSK